MSVVHLDDCELVVRYKFEGEMKVRSWKLEDTGMN